MEEAELRALFTDRGATASANLYSLVESAKAKGKYPTVI